MILTLPVTAWTALVLGAFFLALTWGVIRTRRGGGTPFGDGENRDLMKRIRGQSNAAEQIPIFLIILGLSESAGISALILTPVAVLFILGRLSHGMYFHGSSTFRVD